MSQDAEIFRDIRARIEAIGLFQSVAWGPANSPVSSEFPSVLVYRKSFETPRNSWTTDSKRRRVQFHVEIYHGSSDADSLTAEALDYEAAIINAIDGKSLAGISSPQFTFLEAGKDDPRPETDQFHVVLTGEFSYPVEVGTGVGKGKGLDTKMDDYAPGIDPDSPGYGAGGYGDSPYGNAGTLLPDPISDPLSPGFGTGEYGTSPYGS
jgi:hypothetical protein